ncbi:glycine cleavage system protein GcvH [Segniliparus rugosus]|uniref:Glycine cleavage system H protein n=1 Tax=Segniliparus rugosus (strain ATCC BAA-974 / DSM 45345 / CCUG 50838 / CIP 108380 / JCM 13579 / CDC 945) TaxID=679197 RepID=E5XL60_SEGRC|nr:glycine cleavage system protein GcvH [Segniliparus rugosus]EFV14928.1 glycine cleavage system H protein [Segniliparus rugosus ATCC BAA-974]
MTEHSTPADLRYATDHEWVHELGGQVVRIGITDFAQSQLGDLVYVKLPEVGTEVSASDPLVEVESTKSVSDVFAPVSGTVTKINDALEGAPELVNAQPYGSGWLVEITASDGAVLAGELGGLLDAEGYRAITG